MVAAQIPAIPAATLNAISCVSPATCIAVGSAFRNGTPFPLLVSEYRGRWSGELAPLPSDGAGGWLSAISCGGATECVAVGAFETDADSDDPVSGTLVEEWSDGKWAVAPSPTPGSGNLAVLASVSCSDPQNCIAVGNYSNSNNAYQVDEQALVETGPRTGWQVNAAASIGGNEQSILQFVTCITNRSCIAVGTSALTGYGAANPLVEVWNGETWAEYGGEAANATLESVSCHTSRCLAVGERLGTGGVSFGFSEWLSPTAS
jgi:hypothetical protein